MKLRLVIAAGLMACIAGCATPYDPPIVSPPALWDGVSGWSIDGSSGRVNEGAGAVGDVIIEHDANLARTGIVKKAIALKNAYGKDMIIPEGTKAFATNFTLIVGPRQIAQKIDPIEWCMYLPQGIDGGGKGAETVCTFWEREQQARYGQDSQVGGFSFLPSVHSPSGMPGPVPEIEEQPVDFGFHFKRQVRIAKITPKELTLETVFTDGVHWKRASSQRYGWTPERTYTHSVGDTRVLLTANADWTNVSARQVGESQTARASANVIVDVLVGIDGKAKDARITRSSGSTKTDETILNQVRTNWKFTPATADGKPIEKWTTIKVSIVLEDEEKPRVQPE